MWSILRRREYLPAHTSFADSTYQLQRPFVSLINVNRLSCRRGTRPRLLLRLAGQLLRAQPSQLLPARIQIFSRSLRLEINLDVYLERIWAFQPELLLG